VINSKQIIKIGRQKKILESNDKLQVNDFFEETGYSRSTLHGRFSRVQLVIVDTKDGTGSKAKVGKYNFTIDMFKSIFGVISIDPIKYKELALAYNQSLTPSKNNDFLSGFKIDHYKKDANGYSPTTNIKLTYEEAMRNDSKWKIAIDIGIGIAEKKENLVTVKAGTYKKIETATINITGPELKKLLMDTKDYVDAWEIISFPKMLAFRDAFDDRAKNNKYDESTIAVWNANPSLKNTNYIPNTSSNNKDNVSNINSNNMNKSNSENKINSDNKKNDTGTVTPTSSNLCKCGAKITDTVKNYSMDRFGEILCIKCQAKIKKTA
jgi:hypothetical protein